MAEIRLPITGPSTYSQPPFWPDAESSMVAKDVAGICALARALCGAADRGELASIAVEETRRLTGAEWAVVYELLDGPELPLLAESSGATKRAATDQATAISLSSPEWEAIRTLGPVWITSCADAGERYRGVTLDRSGGVTRCEAWAFLPLIADGELGGVLTIAFAQPRAFEAHDRAWQTEIAAECANALARGSLFTRERTRADAADIAHAALDERFVAAEHLVAEHPLNVCERSTVPSGVDPEHLAPTFDGHDTEKTLGK